MCQSAQRLAGEVLIVEIVSLSIAFTGAAIPASGLWQSDTTMPCETVSGAEMFFSLQRGSSQCPTSYCQLTGLNEANAIVMYFVRDAAGDVSLIIQADAATAANSDGGQLKLYIEADDVAGMGVHPIVYDDPGARNFSDGSWYGSCANIARDCHSWETASGRGYFAWTWVRMHTVFT